MLKLYVLLLVFTLINSECGHRSGACKHRHPRRQSFRQYEHEFYELSSSVISADRQFEALCDSDNSVVEFMGADTYTLQYSLGDYGLEDVAVKIRHRVLYVSARNSTVTFRDVRLLPRVVDVQNGLWYAEHSKLYVLFGYKVPYKTDTPCVCDASIDDRVRHVPNYSGSILLRSIDFTVNSSVIYDDNVV